MAVPIALYPIPIIGQISMGSPDYSNCDQNLPTPRVVGKRGLQKRNRIANYVLR